MKRKAVVFIMLAVLAVSAFAQEEAEPVTELEGRLAMVKGADGQFMAMLRLASGDLVAIELPEGEVARLKLRARDRLRVSGVFIGTTAETKTQARIMAKTMIKNGKTLVVENPVQLTMQDRLQLRAYEEEKLKTRTEAQIQTQAQFQTQAQIQTQAVEGSPGNEAGGTKTGRK